MRAEPVEADWEDEGAYLPLLGIDRAGFAWEWLRRDPKYRAAAATDGEGDARKFGLHRFEPPSLNALAARPLWRADASAFVLQADASRYGPASEQFDIAALEPLATVFGDAEGEHVLLSDGRRSLRLDILSGTVRAGPALLRYRLAGLRRLNGPLLALRQLIHLCRTGRFARRLHPADARAQRWLLLLRAADAVAFGAQQRDIAAVLLDSGARASRWRLNEPSLRSRAQRLVRDAAQMSNGGYRRLLTSAALR